MSPPDAGSVLRRALLAWGLGHIALGRDAVGRALLGAEAASVALIGWLVIGLADTSAYLVPYVAGVVFLVAWGWQAVHAYRLARRADPDADAAPLRSEAVAIGWMALPILVWGAGYWLVAAEDATPAATLDRFVTGWTADELDPAEWGQGVVDEATIAADQLGDGDDRFRDVRVRITDQDGQMAGAVAEAVHYERRPTTFLFIFPGTETVPVADEVLLSLELRADDAPLPGGGTIGAVRWSITDAEAGS